MVFMKSTRNVDSSIAGPAPARPATGLQKFVPVRLMKWNRPELLMKLLENR
jgi:hypothetical protein